jgi:hypothetical protein
VHGEVRLANRAGATVVQTLLFTNALRRGLQQIRKKELYHWPPDREGHEDSRLFLAELERGVDEVSKGVAGDPEDDRRKKLLIEVALSQDSAFFALYEPEIGERDGQVTIESVRPLAVHEVSRAYAARAQRLMAANAFDLTEDEAEALLRSAAGP